MGMRRTGIRGGLPTEIYAVTTRKGYRLYSAASVARGVVTREMRYFKPGHNESGEDFAQRYEADRPRIWRLDITKGEWEEFE